MWKEARKLAVDRKAHGDLVARCKPRAERKMRFRLYSYPKNGLLLKIITSALMALLACPVTHKMRVQDQENEVVAKRRPKKVWWKERSPFLWVPFAVLISQSRNSGTSHVIRALMHLFLPQLAVNGSHLARVLFRFIHRYHARFFLSLVIYPRAGRIFLHLGFRLWSFYPWASSQSIEIRRTTKYSCFPQPSIG